MAKVLLVEDELDLASLINNWLAREHHLVEVVTDGPTALHRLKVAKYDVIILDVMLPGMSGFDICREFRATRGTTPILFLTARTSLQDKELGFLAGADDYLTKPFHLKELDFRVKALLRRGAVSGSNIFQLGDIQVDSDQHKVLKNGSEVHLLPKEFRLLEFFVRHPQRVFSPEELLENVWESDTSAHNDSVRGHITRLRKKLDTPGQPSIISTVYGVGYKLQGDDG
ncbi:response regulator transcription factor [Candidatus Obscuribacterales bacterium]|jgi:DNA-binding response OmpR family regulator|nr:response regulator transcription factor [Candidatus Obscuribacterales bacterium]MBX3136147.1 response regulator transcription factor [Candidatus Obscuribacterales bacterium]MBX3149636.1 response regulator transcription factor [Candidatus Obscuribacterales bacterium]